MSISAAFVGFSSGIGIASFILGFFEDDGVREELARIEDSLRDLEGVAQANLRIEVAGALGGANAALDALARYRNSEDAAQRAVEAGAAIEQSSLALNTAIEQIKTVKQDASLGTLGYFFGVLHYVTFVRARTRSPT